MKRTVLLCLLLTIGYSTAGEDASAEQAVPAIVIPVTKDSLAPTPVSVDDRAGQPRDKRGHFGSGGGYDGGYRGGYYGGYGGGYHHGHGHDYEDGYGEDYRDGYGEGYVPYPVIRTTDVIHTGGGGCTGGDGGGYDYTATVEVTPGQQVTAALVTPVTQDSVTRATVSVDVPAEQSSDERSVFLAALMKPTDVGAAGASEGEDGYRGGHGEDDRDEHGEGYVSYNVRRKTYVIKTNGNGSRGDQDNSTTVEVPSEQRVTTASVTPVTQDSVTLAPTSADVPAQQPSNNRVAFLESLRKQADDSGMGKTFRGDIDNRTWVPVTIQGIKLFVPK